MDEVREADEERDRGLPRGHYGRHPRGLRPLQEIGYGYLGGYAACFKLCRKVFFLRNYVTPNGSCSIFRKGTGRIDRSTVSHSPACSPRTDRGDGGHGGGGGGIGVEGSTA